MTLPLNEKNVERLASITPIVEELYCGLSIVSPPTSLMHLAHIVKAMRVSNRLHIGTEAQENRRYLCVKQALDFENATHIHYCDGDHVLFRIESGYSDWRRILEAMKSVDCLIIGRTQSVMESYPTPLRETEKIINMVGSYFLGQPVDLGTGSRGFSRRATEYLVSNAKFETPAIATDAEWPILLHVAGYSIKAYQSEGAIYEILSDEHRRRLESIEQWKLRVHLAQQIIQATIENSHSEGQLP